MNIRNHLNLGCVGFVSLFCAASAVANETPDSVYIKSIETAGSGCVQGSVQATLSPDNETFSLIFDKYVAEVGAEGSRPIPFGDRKNCLIDIELVVPEGYMFTLLSADYRGFADVDQGAAASYQVTANFFGNEGKPFNRQFMQQMVMAQLKNRKGQGQGQGHGLPPGFEPAPRANNFEQQLFKGPYSGDYEIHNEVTEANARWSDCERNSVRKVRIQTNLTAMGAFPFFAKQSKAHSLIELDTADGQVTQEFGVRWKRCTPGNHQQ